jgi:CPA2 family monovalent cation:H+ antiporter-2
LGLALEQVSSQIIHLAPLIRDLAIILGVAAAVTLIFRLIRQPVVLGYIMAGVIVGPHTPGVLSVMDIPSVRVWAELGVIFLMFALGLEFSFRKLARVGISAAITAIIQVLLMMMIGYAFGRFVGWGSLESFYFGCMISISSTTIIIKAFEELRLKSKLFAQMVFGILIVEDLVAVLILVALSSIAESSSLGGFDLLIAAGKLAFVVGAWFLVGMFIIPRFVKLVRKHGDNEMITVLSIGLCLGLVTLSAYFHYPVALGAFIMGSILAETSEAKKIEVLISPLKDVFGAIFFVSVGMMMDPRVFINHPGFVLLISLLIIVGQICSLTVGSLITGQTLSNSVRTSFSMAQIGEFSFIIATLGRAYGVIHEDLFPMIIAASLITTFTTPYLMRLAPKVGDMLDRHLPSPFKRGLQSYSTLMQKGQSGLESKKELPQLLLQWGANAIIVVVIFLFNGRTLLPLLLKQGFDPLIGRGLNWLFAISMSAPFLWGMTQVFARMTKEDIHDTRLAELIRRSGSYLSQILSILLVGVLSMQFFPIWISVLLTLLVIVMVTIIFKTPLEAFYRWFESQFHSGFQAHNDEKKSAEMLSSLAPWDAHLVSVVVHPNSTVVAKRLQDLQLREEHGLNIVAIQRGSRIIVAPKANDVLLPDDQLLFLGTDDEIEKIRSILEHPAIQHEEDRISEFSTYRLRTISVNEGSSLVGCSILQSGIREKFGGMVVGVERQGKRIFNPKSDFIIHKNDVLLVVGLGALGDLPEFLDAKP